MSADLLEVREVSFAYPGRSILHDLCFTLQQGEAVALLGPNGAGKTTLLRICAGLVTPDAGDVLLQGMPLLRIPRTERARRIALVPQALEIPFSFTVEEVVSQGRTPYLGLLGRHRLQDREAIERAYALTGTGEFRDRVFNELSGGERQRVKIAMGLAQGPNLLLLDEPAQSLDVGWQKELLSMIGGLSEQGIAILAAVHELHLVTEYFSRSLLLAPGMPLQSGPSADLLASEKLHDAFYRRPLISRG